MCWLDDVFYSKCGHWGRRLVKTPCAIGMHHPYQTTGCWNSNATGMSRIDRFCQNCKRRELIRRHEVARPASAPAILNTQVLDPREEKLSAGRKTSICRSRQNETLSLGALMKAKGQQTEIWRNEADDEKDKVETIGEKQFGSDLEGFNLNSKRRQLYSDGEQAGPAVDSQTDEETQADGHSETQSTEERTENQVKPQKKLLQKSSFQKKLRSWRPFSKKSRREKLPPIEEQGEEHDEYQGKISEDTQNSTQEVSFSLLRGLQQAFEKNDDNAIMILLELAAGKKLPPLPSSLRRAVSHAVLSHDTYELSLLIEVVRSTAPLP